MSCCYPDCFHCPFVDCVNDNITEDEGITDLQAGVVPTYYSEHRQEVLEKAKKRRIEHGEAMRAKERERYANLSSEDKRKKVANNRKNYWKNPEEARRKKREYYQRKKRELAISK
jgi:hypothetical protein